MACSSRDFNSSDEEPLHRVDKRKRKSKKNVIKSSDSEEDSDIEVKPKRAARILPCDSDSELHCDNSNVTDLSSNDLSSWTTNGENNGTVANDSDNEQTEKCAICLSKFSGQDVATPETCDHTFCLDCLQKWAEKVNTCPIDRLKFNLILIRHHKKDRIIRRISVENPAHFFDIESNSSDATYCELCGACDNEATLLLCDECEQGFHCECLNPPLRSVPTGPWFCPDCRTIVTRRRNPLGFREYEYRQMIQSHFRNNAISGSGLSRSSNSLQIQRHAPRRSYQSRYQEIARQSLNPVQRIPGYYDTNSYLSSSDSSDDDGLSRSIQAEVFDNMNLARRMGSFVREKFMRGIRNLSAMNVNSYSSATTVSTVAERRNIDTDSEDDFNSQRESSEPSAENYDLVGTILQSQSILHCPGIPARKSGSVLFSDLSTNASPSAQNHRTIPADIVISSKTEDVMIRLANNDTSTLSLDPNPESVTQCPLNPMQKQSSKYVETPSQAPSYSCETSSSGIAGSSLYDSSNISRTSHDSSNLDQLSGSSHISGQRNFDSCLTAETMKADHHNSSSLKETNKEHSEDEVDIYSDIESVGEEDAILSNQVSEPIKVGFKCDESQLNVGVEGSDSSDNELVIDEGHAEEEHDKAKGNRVSKEISGSSDANHNESEDSNHSGSEHLDFDSQHNIESNDSCQHSGSQQLDFDSQQNLESNSSCQPSGTMESDIFKDCHSPLHEDRLSSEPFSPKSSPLMEEQRQAVSESKSESEGEIGGQESEGEIGIDEENSVDNSLRNEAGTPYSLTSSPIAEEQKPAEIDSHCENSASNENISFEHNRSSSDIQEVRNDTDDEQCKHDDGNDENTRDSVMEIDDNEHSMQSFNSQSEEGEIEDSQDHDMNESCVNYGEDGSGSVLESEDNIASNASHKLEESKQMGEIYTQNENTLCFDENEASNPASEEGSENAASEFQNNSEVSIKNRNQDVIFLGNKVGFSSRITNDYKMVSKASLKDFTGVEDFRTSDSRNATDNVIQLDSSVEEKEMSIEEGNQQSTSLHPGIVDLGIEDISDSESVGLNSEYPNDASPEKPEQELTAEEQVANLFLRSGMDVNFEDDVAKDLNSSIVNSTHSNQSYEDQEEGEIIEERPERKKNRKCDTKHGHHKEESQDYGDIAPRVNISDLPRIPKIKRSKERNDKIEVPSDVKRTSVLGRVDLGGADISWKRLSKHTRERSYRDGKPKDERLLFRERESRSKDKRNANANENERRHSKNKDCDHRRDDKKQDFEKRSERERKADRSKDSEKGKDWSYAVQEKSERHERHSKSRKEREKRSKDKDKREKGRHDKSRHCKGEDKHERDRSKEEIRYEREVVRCDRGEERFERVVYEKGKFKEKEHKSKRKERKSECTKERSRDKHKHTHSGERFSDKQKEREVRKIDDKLKIVLGQKESRKDKSEKHAGKKEQKRDKKHREEICHHEHKKERSVSPYTELAPIESKEIFAKGDSIIINVNYNRPSDKEIVNSEEKIPVAIEKKSTSDIEPDEPMPVAETKTKAKTTPDKRNSMEVSLSKRPSTPPERNVPKISVGECYWKETDETDLNSVTSDKSVEEIPCEEENTNDSTGGFEGDDNNYSDSSSSSDLPETQSVQQLEPEQLASVLEKPAEDIPQKEEAFHLPRRKSPRSPSPPSPADNDSYDPCEPTKSPSPPPPIPPAPPLPVPNPKPPPSPELPPLPPDPEPSDTISKEDPVSVVPAPPHPSDFMAVTAAMMLPTSQPVAQQMVTSAAPMSSILAPPPFLSQAASTATGGAASIPPLMPPRNFNFQMGSQPAMMFPAANHVQQVMQHNNFIHAQNTMQHIQTAQMAPPPHGAMMSQVRHPQMHSSQLNANTMLQNMQLGHQVNMQQLQLAHLHHLPPVLANVIANHHPSMLIPSQNQSVSLPVTIHNQQVSHSVLPQVTNNTLSLQNLQSLNLMHLQPHNNLNSMQHNQTSITGINVPQKVEKQKKHSSPIDQSEVIDMDVDSPYSPGDSPSLDSGCDYSPTCSPIASVPQVSNTVKDIFDSLLPSEQRIIRNQDGKTEKNKNRSDPKNTLDPPNKRAKLDSSRAKQSVRMQTNKNSTRKEQKLADKKELPKLDDSELTILDELPSSAVEMQVKEKYIKKLNRQERVVEEVKMTLKPYYKSRHVTKDEYKDILRKTVPKICHNRSGEINPVKVKSLVESYVKKIKHAKKKSRKGRKKSKFS